MLVRPLAVLVASSILGLSACGDDSSSGGGTTGGQGGGGLGGQATGGQGSGGGPMQGDPCREDAECGSGELLCFLPGECNSGAGECPGPSHCLVGETPTFDNSCEPQLCDLAMPQCPEASTCTTSMCNGAPCDVCLPDVTTCSNDGQCPLGYACTVGECRQGCASDAECGSANLVCDDLHECVPTTCTVDGDCTDGFCLGGLCFDTLGICQQPAA